MQNSVQAIGMIPRKLLVIYYRFIKQLRRQLMFKFSLLFNASKAIKVLRIRLGFLLPTIYAKVYLTMMHCTYGENLKVCGKVYFRPGSLDCICLGNNVSLTARFLTNSVGLSNPIMFDCQKNGRIEIGNNSGLSSTILSSRQLIKIGENVNIGGNVRIFDHDFHSLNYLIRRKGGQEEIEDTKSSPIIIEDDVFIGTNSIILKGVHVGARSIVSAGSVVMLKNIPDDSMVAGNPAVVVRYNINEPL
jgi:acetyltransferase-like isoleucine patch superfamily enzyme